MKRIAMLVAVLSIASWATSQTYGQGGQQSPPAAGQASQAGQTTPPGKAAPAGGAAAPQAKRPPQFKTTPEQDTYNAAVAITDPASFEKAADDFAAKFPDSEVRVLLYKNAMRIYQNTNNADKTEAMGRKVLAIDGDEPEALVMVAEVIAERTHDSDLDKDQRYDEAVKMAQKAIQTVDTDTAFNPATPQEKIDAYKGLLRSNAYSVLGTIAFKKDSFGDAQESLQKSIDAYPAQPDPVVVLRLAIALDKQQKYPDALKVANRAVELTKETEQTGVLARRERDRLQQLTGGAAPALPAQPPAQPPKN